jgi:hypothetical protein
MRTEFGWGGRRVVLDRRRADFERARRLKNDTRSRRVEEAPSARIAYDYCTTRPRRASRQRIFVRPRPRRSMDELVIRT